MPSSTGGDPTVTSTTASTVIKDTKKKAEEACDAGDVAAVAGSGTECTLK
jgi:hypothetical protein